MRRPRRFALRGGMRALAIAIACAVAHPSRGQEPGASLEGYTGLLTTPSAWVQAEGTAQVLATNSSDRVVPSRNLYTLTIGAFSHLELAGRLTDAHTLADGQPGPQDLSFNGKLQLPLDLLWPDLPVAIAVGGQDLAGTASYFRSAYAVASARLWRLDASVGWGAGPDRLKGVFGGAALRVIDGVADVLADWDTVDARAGARVSLPLDRIGLPIRVGGSVSRVLTDGPKEWVWSAVLEVPLGIDTERGRRTPPPVDAPSRDVPPPSAAPSPPQDPVAAPATPAPAPSPAASSPSAPEPSAAPQLDPLERLARALVAAGFQDVRAGREGDLVVVEYENNRYQHDQADGLYVVLREIELAHLSAARVAVVLKRGRLRFVELEFRGRVGEPFRWAGDAPAWRWLPPEHERAWASSARNSSFLRPQLAIAPGLRTFIATEVGLFDYVLSLRPDLLVPLWPGAVAFGRADIPVLWSSNLDDGGPLRRYRDPPRIEYGLLQQVFPLGGRVMGMLSAGLYRTSDAGVLAELAWPLAEGSVLLGAQGAWTVNSDWQQHRAATASATARLDAIDLVGTVRAGRFVNGDDGVRIELAKWFGVTQFGVFFTRSDASLAGAFISFPLTFRRDMNPSPVQVRGARRWQYELSSVVAQSSNPVTISLGIPPVAPWNLQSEFFDGTRVSRDGLVEPIREMRSAETR